MSDEMKEKRDLSAMNRRNFLYLGALGSAAAAFVPGAAFAGEREEKIIRAWEGKSVLITGATSGLGEYMAIDFARRGAKVSICGRRTEKGEAVLKKIKAAGGVGIFSKADVRSERDVKKFVQKTVDSFGRIDVAINNAGIEYSSPDFSADDMEKHVDVINTNLIGMMFCLRYEIHQMQKQGAGSIVNLGSMNAVRSSIVAPAYAASKHGVIGFTRSFAKRYGRSGIRVNAVSPYVLNHEMGKDGFVDETSEDNRHTLTQIPLGRFITMADVTQAISWLASDEASMVSGHNLLLDGASNA